jgi:pilus assembly protein TadC
MTRNNSFAGLILLLILGIGAGLAYALYRPSAYAASLWTAACALIIAFVVSAAIKVADPTIEAP